MIEAESLTKRYGDLVAIEDVSFEVPKGAVVGLLGPNGAGKSTVMKILTCFMPPTQGRARICGHDIFDAPLEVKRSIGYLPEHPPVYPDLTVEGQITYAAQLKEVPSRTRKASVAAAMERAGISHQARRLVGNLSKGYQQRVGIAQALVHDPPVLVLDEPTVGLDPSQILEIRRLIQELGRSHTVILSTHILPEVTVTCDRVVIIDRGHIAAQGTLDEVTRKVVGADLLLVRLDAPEDEAAAALAELTGVEEVRPAAPPGPGAAPTGCARHLRTAEGVDVRRDLFELCTQKDWPILELRPPGLSLEEVFLRITSRDAREVGA